MALRNRFISGSIGAAIVLGAAPAALADSAQDTITVWEVERSGRPPFERRQVTLPVADTAVMEVREATLPTAEQWVVDTSGKPPHRRRKVELPVFDAASLELAPADDAVRSPRRGKPPFRRH